jgi:hypothetical protein
MYYKSAPFKMAVLRSVLVLHVIGDAASVTVAHQFPNAKAQISEQAAYSATQPAKVNAKLLTQEIAVGDQPVIEIDVLNAENQRVAVKRDLECEASVHFASGKIITKRVQIKKGQASTQTDFVASETGFVSIVVRPQDEGIRSDTVELIVRSSQKSNQKKQTPRGASNESAPGFYAMAPKRRVDRISTRLRMVNFGVPQKVVHATSHSATKGNEASPTLHISLSDPNGIYHANGIDAAVISAVFESPDLSPTPVDIHVWFKWTNGSLSPPQPLQIKKGTFSATMQLTSPSPAEVHLSFVNSSPAFQVEGDKDAILHFVPVGAALVGPQKLSVVDNTPVMLVFYDANQNPVAPGKNWPVTLRSTQSKVHFTPERFEVQAASPSGSALLFPVSWGTDTVEAVVANYTIKPLTILITGWIILALCLAGGMAGGLAAYNKFKGSWIWRLFLGMLGGATLCWLYVYLALPNLDVNIAHNTFSVFFVALLGGYGGTNILDFAAKKLGWVT